MANKYEIIERMLDCGITAVVRTDSSEELVNVAEAINKGGVDTIEITMTTPGALDVVSAVAKKFGDDLDNVRAAMRTLASAFAPDDLAGAAYSLYERFRPNIPPGKRGWGAKGTLDLKLIRSLAAGSI